MNCETSAQEVRTQFLQVRDNGSPENMQVQDNLLDKDIILKPLNTKATVHNSPQTDKDFRKPKQPSEFLRGGEEEDPQNLPRTPSGRAPEIPWELPKTERQDEDAWESLSPNHSQEEERCPSSCDSDYSARLHFRTTTQRPTAERVHVSTERTVDNGREIPIRNGPPPRRTLEPTRYVVEDGKTIPVERRKSPVEQTKNNLWETVERLHLDQKLSRQRTSPIIGEGRTNRRRSGYGDGRLYRDDFGGGSFISLTEDNLRKHDYQAEPLLKWGPWDPNVCKHDYQAEPLHKWGPNDCLREVFLESHPLFTSTRAPAGQGMPQSRSPSHRGTAQPPTEQHVRPSFYADEHGFVEHAPSPPPVLEQREQFAQDKHVAGVREYMEYRPRADDTDWRSRQRDPNPFSEPPLDDLLDF
ncbi:hypothetical protein BKA64DRAFT_128217 [Cadophora sp. MPI-SDFR-AT-0126]|nr:hypothetical protein BKA64DRAFT_128217 [Leotiomycetes sp. MPI-SDFR-AT-0126]